MMCLELQRSTRYYKYDNENFVRFKHLFYFDEILKSEIKFSLFIQKFISKYCSKTEMFNW